MSIKNRESIVKVLWYIGIAMTLLRSEWWYFIASAFSVIRHVLYSDALDERAVREAGKIHVNTGGSSAEAPPDKLVLIVKAVDVGVTFLLNLVRLLIVAVAGLFLRKIFGF